MRPPVGPRGSIPARRILIGSLCVLTSLLVGCSSGDTPGAGSSARRADRNSTAARPTASSVEALLALDRPIVLAHAGGDDIHPHDTPFGFDRSAALGVDALDMDVQLSADGVLVVQHDDTVDRMRVMHEEEGWGYRRLARHFDTPRDTVRSLCKYRRR